MLPKEEEGYKRSTRSSNMKETIGKINSSSGARPWSGTCARMKVIESPKGTKDRYKKLRERKMAWNQILSKSPHVTVRFGIGTEDCNALLDAGADWSLIDDSLLHEKERRELEQSGAWAPRKRREWRIYNDIGRSLENSYTWRALYIRTTVRRGSGAIIPGDSGGRLVGTRLTITNRFPQP